jgi:hypothetical protein
VRTRLLAVLLISNLLLLPNTASAQRKDKAEAIKTAAQLFGTDSKQAVESLRALLQGSLTFTPDDDPEAVTAGLTTAFTKQGAKITDVVNGFMKADPQVRTPPTDSELTKLESLYASYSAAFNSLPQGAWFAKTAVRNAESLNLKLTKQMSVLANTLLNVPGYGEPINQESAISANILRALAESDEKKKLQDLNTQVAALVALKAHFQSDRDNVIKQLLTAAQAGLANHKLMVAFEKITLMDILSQLQSLFGAIAQSGLPGPHSNLKNWYTQINTDLNTLEKGSDTSTLFQ